MVCNTCSWAGHVELPKPFSITALPASLEQNSTAQSPRMSFQRCWRRIEACSHLCSVTQGVVTAPCRAAPAGREGAFSAPRTEAPGRAPRTCCFRTVDSGRCSKWLEGKTNLQNATSPGLAIYTQRFVLPALCNKLNSDSIKHACVTRKWVWKTPWVYLQLPPTPSHPGISHGTRMSRKGRVSGVCS